MQPDLSTILPWVSLLTVLISLLLSMGAIFVSTTKVNQRQPFGILLKLFASAPMTHDKTTTRELMLKTARLLWEIELVGDGGYAYLLSWIASAGQQELDQLRKELYKQFLIVLKDV